MEKNTSLTTQKTSKHLISRFLTSSLIPVVLLCISLSFGLLNIQRQYFFTQKELSGVKTIGTLFDAFIDLQVIRGLSNILYQKKIPDFITKRKQLSKRFKNRFTTTEWKILTKKFNIENELQKIVAEAQSIYNSKILKMTESERFGKYTKLIEQLGRIRLVVINRSNLTLDPEIDTHYLSEIAIVQIPDLCEAFASIRGIGSGIIARRNTNPKEREILKNKISVVRFWLDEFNRTRYIIHNAEIKNKISINYNEDKFNQASTIFLNKCRMVINNNHHISAVDFFRQGSDVIKILADPFHTAIDMLNQRLKGRLTRLIRILILSITVSLTAFAFIIYFAFSFYRLLQKSYLELERISITDPLTAIPNRRYMEMIFDKELQRSRRNNQSIAFGILDIDFFKKFNDTYGHHEGDIALQKVAGALRESLKRSGDFYFRFGGEEFCILFRASSLQEAEGIGEKVRKAVEQLKIEHKENMDYKVVTISAGVVFLSEITNENLDYVLKHADNLLYMAKDSGRNKMYCRKLK